MFWAIIGIIVFGLILLVFEFFLFPGTTLVGIGGLVMLAIGIMLAYGEMDRNTAHLVTGGSVLLAGVLMVFGYKTISSGKMALESTLEGRVNEVNVGFKEGTTGYAYTDLKPSGKAMINGQKLEVQSLSDFIDRETPIIVHKIETNKIIVKKHII